VYQFNDGVLMNVRTLSLTIAIAMISGLLVFGYQNCAGKSSLDPKDLSSTGGHDDDDDDDPVKPYVPPEMTASYSFSEATGIRPYTVTGMGLDALATGSDKLEEATGNRAAVAMRLGLAGNVVWAKKLDGVRNDQFITHAVIGTNLNAMGITRTVFAGSTQNTDVLWTKFNTDTGAVIESRRLGTGRNEDALDMRVTADGFAYVGASEQNATAPILKDGYIARVLSATNAVSWARQWSTPGDEQFRSLQVVADGIYVFGYTTMTAGGTQDPLVLKYDLAGTLLWAYRIVGANNNDYVFSGRVLSDGLLMVGSTQTNAGGTSDFLAIKLSLNGANVMWAKSYASASGDDIFRGINLLNSTSVLVSGQSLQSNGAGGTVILQLNTSTGAIENNLSLGDNTGRTNRTDHETLWTRSDGGFGLLYFASNLGSEVSSLEMALPNRLLKYNPATCALAQKPIYAVSNLTLVATAAAGTVSNLTITNAVIPAATIPEAALTLTKTGVCN
jgi:hypothetical protein